MALSIIGGEYRGKKLFPPALNSGVRPTSSLLRGAVFDILRERLPSSHFLELYAGSGAVGIEALSQGALKSVLVEKNPEVFSLLKKNVELFNSKKLQIHHEKSLSFCKKCDTQNISFNIIFVDPPFEDDFDPLFDAIHPLLAKNGALLVQFPKRAKPTWLSNCQQIKKYGESSLAIFYN